MESQPTSVQFITVDADREGQRIDNYLLGTLKGAPRSLVYRILRRGEVRVNKGRVKPHYRLCVGDEVRIPPVQVTTPKQMLPSTNLQALLTRCILFENDRLMVVNKPAGLAVHGGSGINTGLIESLRAMRPEEKSLELVHRLDRETSGCIMVSKHRAELRKLHAALREHHIDKHYLALVKGFWPEHLKEVNAPLQKNQLQSGERMVKVDPEGKPSRTLFKVVEHFRGATLVQASPVTGRTHQIRVHARAAGFPLIGDEKYGCRNANKEMAELGFKRLFLHAVTLDLKAVTDPPLRISAPVDETWEAAIASLRQKQPTQE